MLAWWAFVEEMFLPAVATANCGQHEVDNARAAKDLRLPHTLRETGPLLPLCLFHPPPLQAFSPNRFVDTLPGEFRGGGQQDSFEFGRSLIDRIEQECKER